MKPKWTTEKPTEEGAYWLKAAEFEPLVVTVYDGLGGLWVSYPGSDMDDFLASVDGEWAGPLEEPEE